MSAIEWLIDRYRVKPDKASGIVNDPNLYSDDRRYIIDLVARIVRVSMESVAIIDALPKLGSCSNRPGWHQSRLVAAFGVGWHGRLDRTSVANPVATGLRSSIRLAKQAPLTRRKSVGRVGLEPTT